ncbi:DUF6575 domain-containing protein [Colwellia psychrerythraea]|uniref:DUF6575 domain-containing protein n=1 Tax=Colwellia psychrerythraea (strain 34H / ATCC BAA-681) TaxID=167879 RepID=Q489K7_COLP3|nr:DUF6575 domain-containing protein [Colwellia psychrerythraea]AAZ24264.1 hypothetical protein CPS_0499 [Colwellia psychrerythraea 34H]
MEILPKSAYFGNLEIFHVYEYYEGPKLFSAVNGVGTYYIAFWIGSNDDGDEWLYAPVSDQRLIELEQSKIKLRDVFIYPNDLVFKVETYFNEDITSQVQQYSASQLTDEILPPSTFYIELTDNLSKSFQVEDGEDVTELYIKRFAGRLAPNLASISKVADAFSSLYLEILKSLKIRNKSLTPLDARPGSFILRLKSPNIKECLPVIKTIFNILNEEQNPFPKLLELNIDVSTIETLLEEVIDGKVKIQFGLAEKFEAELNISKEKALESLEQLKEQSSSLISSLLVPQANNLSKIFHAVELKSEGRFITPSLLNLTTERQVAYYLHAARTLGLLSKNNAINSVGYQFSTMSYAQKMNIVAIRFESSDCGWAWLKWSNKKSVDELDPSTATAFLIEKCPSLSKNTAERRAKTLSMWQRELKPFRTMTSVSEQIIQPTD